MLPRGDAWRCTSPAPTSSSRSSDPELDGAARLLAAVAGVRDRRGVPRRVPGGLRAARRARRAATGSTVERCTAQATPSRTRSRRLVRAFAAPRYRRGLRARHPRPRRRAASSSAARRCARRGPAALRAGRARAGRAVLGRAGATTRTSAHWLERARRRGLRSSACSAQPRRARRSCAAEMRAGHRRRSCATRGLAVDGADAGAARRRTCVDELAGGEPPCASAAPRDAGRRAARRLRRIAGRAGLRGRPARARRAAPRALARSRALAVRAVRTTPDRRAARALRREAAALLLTDAHARPRVSTRRSSAPRRRAARHAPAHPRAAR